MIKISKYLNYLHNPYIISIVGGLLITYYAYVDKITNSNKMVENYKMYINHFKLFFVSSLIISLLLPYYHIPKRIFKEKILIDDHPF